MKSIIPIFIALCFFQLSTAQEMPYKGPDEFLIGDRQVPQVLLMGTWHFTYPGLDEHKTKEEDKINIFTPKRQEELQELLDYVAQFQPTKIIVESGANTGYLMNRYRRWKKGEEELYANERDQVGIRLMDQLGLDTIYGCDAWGLLGDLHEKIGDSEADQYIKKVGDRHYFGGKDEWMKRYKEWYVYSDKQMPHNTLLENFLYLNQDKVIDRYFGAYISGGQFDSEAFEGPDALSMFWMNRNLRIFHKIQQLDIQDDDRLLILFGAGHMGILRWLYECSPRYELVEFDSLNDFTVR